MYLQLNQNLIHQNWQATFKVTSNAVCFIFILLCSHMSTVNGQQRNLITSNKCETVTNTGVIYSACVSESQFLFRNPTFTLNVDPPGSTCGTPAAAYCRLVRFLFCVLCNGLKTKKKGIGAQVDKFWCDLICLSRFITINSKFIFVLTKNLICHQTLFVFPNIKLPF